MAKIDEKRPFLAVRIAVLTVSDTRTAAEDKSGDSLAEMIAPQGTRSPIAPLSGTTWRVSRPR
jgi:molybdenum cofactor biosynthesis protein B